MSARVVANPAFEAQLAALLDERLGLVVVELADKVRGKIDTPYPPSSDPGQPPHKRSGELQDGVFHERVESGVWDFGYQGVGHGLYMELGTGIHRHAPVGDGGITPNPNAEALTSVEPRPALLPTLLEDGPGIAQTHFGGL